MILTYQAMKVKGNTAISRTSGATQICTNIQNGKVDSVWGSTQPKIRVASKNSLNKNDSKLNFVQKSPWAHMSISPYSGARDSKDSHLWKIIMYKNGKVDSVWGSMPPKTRITSKIALNKSCSKLNFIQKSVRAHMPIFPRSEARGPSLWFSL